MDLESLPDASAPAHVVGADGAQTPALRPSAEEQFRAGVLSLGLADRAAKRQKRDEEPAAAAAGGPTAAAAAKARHPAEHFAGARERVLRAHGELMQLSNLLGLLKGGEYVGQEHLAARAPARRQPRGVSLGLLLHAKRAHMGEAARLLRDGLGRVRAGVARNRRFVAGLRRVQRHWLVVAPQHGGTVAPLRAGELLAVDASMASAGSAWAPGHAQLSLQQVAACVLGQTPAGDVQLAPPPLHAPVALEVAVSGAPPAFVAFRGEPEAEFAFPHVAQASAWASELFQRALDDARQPDAAWLAAAGAAAPARAPLVVLRATDAELEVRLDAERRLTLRLRPAAEVAAVTEETSGGVLAAVAASALQRRLLGILRGARAARAEARGLPAAPAQPLLRPVVAALREELLARAVRAELDALSRLLARRAHGATVTLRAVWRSAATVDLRLGAVAVTATLRDGAVHLPAPRVTGPSATGPHALRTAAELRAVLVAEARREQTAQLLREARALPGPLVVLCGADTTSGVVGDDIRVATAMDADGLRVECSAGDLTAGGRRDVVSGWVGLLSGSR